MIKKALIVNTPTVANPQAQYLSIEFTDGSFVNLDEEELKNAAVLADLARCNNRSLNSPCDK